MTTYRWSFDEDVNHFRAAGVAGIGVWRKKLSDFGEERGIDLLIESGLSVASLSCAGGFTGSDGQTFREAVEEGLEAVRLAAEMRAECLVVVTGSRSGHTANHARRLVSEALSELGDLGSELGVQIAVQSLHRQPVDRCSFLTSLDATIGLLEHCGHRHVGMVFDLHHLCRQPTVVERLADVAPWIKIATLSELACTAAPEGSGIDLAHIADALGRQGFRGWYELQVLCESAWRLDYDQAIASWRQALHGASPELFPLAGGASPLNGAAPAGADAPQSIASIPGHRR
jgi:sugar phosphate isomerase/epimerase